MTWESPAIVLAVLSIVAIIFRVSNRYSKQEKILEDHEKLKQHHLKHPCVPEEYCHEAQEECRATILNSIKAIQFSFATMDKRQSLFENRQEVMEADIKELKIKQATSTEKLHEYQLQQSATLARIEQKLDGMRK